MKQLICIAALALAILLGGCAGQHEAQPAPVTQTPEWSIADAADPAGTAADTQIRVHLDNTQSTHGFAGKDGPIAWVMTKITDWARFVDGITTWILEPINGTKILEWRKRDPHFLQSALLRSGWELYTINDEDFAEDSGGPISMLFSQAADPNAVIVLVTDMLEQQSCLEPLLCYAADLFQSAAHQQLRIYVANSAYDGKVSFPVIIGEKFAIRSSMFSGQRPFVVIAAGPAEGMEQLDRIIADCGVEFTTFMVENRREDQALNLTVRPSDVMEQNIFITDPAGAMCSLDVEPLPGLEDCFAYRYHKYSAQHEPVSRVSLLIEVDEGRELTTGDIVWWEWQPVQPAETAETTEETAETNAPTEPAGYAWTPCAAPSGAVLQLKRLEPGSALSDRSADESGVADITIPEGKWVYELSILMAGDAFDARAYAVEAALNTPLPANPLADTGAFRKWSTTFAAYNLLPDINTVLETADPASAEAEAARRLKDETLARIPDLELLLQALSTMDTGAAETQAAAVRMILQNYN